MVILKCSLALLPTAALDRAAVSSLLSTSGTHPTAAQTKAAAPPRRNRSTAAAPTKALLLNPLKPRPTGRPAHYRDCSFARVEDWTSEPGSGWLHGEGIRPACAGGEQARSHRADRVDGGGQRQARWLHLTFFSSPNTESTYLDPQRNTTYNRTSFAYCKPGLRSKHLLGAGRQPLSDPRRSDKAAKEKPGDHHRRWRIDE